MIQITKWKIWKLKIQSPLGAKFETPRSNAIAVSFASFLSAFPSLEATKRISDLTNGSQQPTATSERDPPPNSWRPAPTWDV